MKELNPVSFFPALIFFLLKHSIVVEQVLVVKLIEKVDRLHVSIVSAEESETNEPPALGLFHLRTTCHAF